MAANAGAYDVHPNLEKPWGRALRDAQLSGALASLASLAAMVGTGRVENRRPTEPVNAVSHWVWGWPAIHTDRPDWRHTLLGYAIHHGASVFWAVLYERWLARAARRNRARAVACGAATAVCAAVVDLRVVPKRLSPGFEHCLTRRSLFLVYAAFALGMALPALLRGPGR